jgi:bifunctional DNA-binding transcriptional regulator/antitoxin component of YhaV-PrlF toxin-antitoxin module
MIKAAEANVIDDMAITSQKDSPDRKIIRISGKRQITIPQEYFSDLGFERDAICYIDGDSMVIKPLSRSGREFSEFILADLIKEGYEKEELLEEFVRRQSKMRTATEALIREAELSAEDPNNHTNVDELFAESS